MRYKPPRPSSTLPVSGSAPLTAPFVAEGAGFRSTLGWYTIAPDGAIESPRILFDNASAQGSGGTLQPGVSTATLDGIQAGDQIGFFLIADGFDENNGFAGFDLAGGELAFLNQTGDPASIDDAAPTLHVDGLPLAGAIFHSAARGETLDLNADGVQHAISGADPATGELLIGFEDLIGGGDQDYEDLVFRLDRVPNEVTTLATMAMDEGLTLSSPDGNSLVQAVIAIDEGFTGDRLVVDEIQFSIESGGIVGISIAIAGNGTGTMVLEGAASADQYQDILRAIQFENPLRNPDSGVREVSFSVTDSDNATSTPVSIGLDVTDPIGAGPLVGLFDAPGGGDGDGEEAEYPDVEPLAEGYTVFGEPADGPAIEPDLT